MKAVLTIAASDSSCGAGVEVDTAVFRELGVYPLCAVTNVTAQDSRGVHKVFKVAPKIVAAQIDAVTRDFKPAACKIGMLYSPRMVDLAADRIHRRELKNVILDPVMKAKNGEVLLTETAIKRMKRRLIPRVDLITPNAYEAEVLTGIKITDIASAHAAAEALVDMGASAALVKGGHIEGDPIDVLFDGTSFHDFTGKRMDKHMHGTGCALSAAIAARLALGDSLLAAIEFAKDYVTKAIEHSIRLGKGRMDYFTGSQ